MIALVLSVLPVIAQSDAPTWNDDVRPILSERCFACHGPDPATRAADLRLDTPEGLAGDGGAFPPVVPGDAEESELHYRITAEEEFERMPPAEAGAALTEDEVDTIRRWIEAGAAWTPHWAYAPFGESAGAAAGLDSIDAFVAKRHRELGLAFAPEADPRDLLRRVHLDLTGLPPSPEAVRAFVSDPSNEAYEGVVDGLLESLAYGEHWARQWLDAARYADSHGYTVDSARSIWPWRDWVIRSIARDQPFDEFTVEQLAGDLLPGATRAQRIATGFHRNTQVNQEGGAKDEENRVNAVLDRVATTGSVWLGTTLGCAQCHAHKFDPITHEDYFGVYAYFNSTTDAGVSAAPSMLVPRDDEEESAALAWEARRDALDAEYLEAWRHAAEGWTPWQPAIATGSNGPELRPEREGSFRVVGQNAVFSTYVLQGPAPLDSLRSLRLEALPEGGPGRARNGNFVLQRIEVAVRDSGSEAGAEPGEWLEVRLERARADFEQDTRETGGGHYPVESVITGEGAGWAIKPEFRKPHAAEFVLAEAVDLRGKELRVLLLQESGANHTLGAFRLLLSPSEIDGDELVPAPWTAATKEMREHRAAAPRIPTTLVLEERIDPRTTRRFERGSFLDPREVVEPHVPEALDRFRGAGGEPVTNRLEFARWLVHPGNALVHRVTVNRWWQHLFGRGLVPTENDFGLRGAKPTHPELLEWLAGDYVDNGFSRRHVLKAIVMSRTYRQASVGAAAAEEMDPDNRLMTRMPRRPLTGEALRDVMLAVTGVLDPTPFGAPVQPPQPDGVLSFTQSQRRWVPSEGADRFRRSIYTRIWRSAPFAFYATFDAPSASVACTRRVRSQTPLQALALANDAMVIELCGAFGERVVAETPEGNEESRIGHAFELALGRAPTGPEVALLGAHLDAVAEAGEDADRWPALARVLFNLGEFAHRP